MSAVFWTGAAGTRPSSRSRSVSESIAVVHSAFRPAATRGSQSAYRRRGTPRRGRAFHRFTQRLPVTVGERRDDDVAVGGFEGVVREQRRMRVPLPGRRLAVKEYWYTVARTAAPLSRTWPYRRTRPRLCVRGDDGREDADSVQYGSEEVADVRATFVGGPSLPLLDAEKRAWARGRASARPYRWVSPVRGSPKPRTDGRFALDVILPAGGSKHPPSDETVSEGLHTLDVPNHESMKERLAAVSLPNFTVADAPTVEAQDRPHVAFLVAVTHERGVRPDEVAAGAFDLYHVAR